MEVGTAAEAAIASQGSQGASAEPKCAYSYTIFNAPHKSHLFLI